MQRQIRYFLTLNNYFTMLMQLARCDSLIQVFPDVPHIILVTFELSIKLPKYCDKATETENDRDLTKMNHFIRLTLYGINRDV